MVKCPKCGKAVSDSSKEWDYATFRVKLFKCPECNKTFKAYYRQNKLSHTIPKSKRAS